MFSNSENGEKDFYHKTFKATTTLRDTYNKYYEDNVIGLTITGNPGTRKSFIMNDIQKYLESKGFKIIHQVEPGALILKEKEVVEYYRNKHYRD